MRYIMSPTETPWGEWVTFEEGPGFTIKRLTVKPGKRTSLQRHAHRSEHWYVASGRASITIGPNGNRVHLPAGCALDVQVGVLHRIANEGKEDLVIVEVWRGDVLREADIERLEDDYGRTEPPPVYKVCTICGERYDEAKDQYHVDACRDSRKP